MPAFDYIHMAMHLHKWMQLAEEWSVGFSVVSSITVPVRSYEGFGTTQALVCLSGEEVFSRVGTLTPKGLCAKVYQNHRTNLQYR